MLHNLMDAHWSHNEAIEMHVCNLSKGLEIFKFDKIMTTAVIKQLIHG